ncbi:MAG: hypothetical protein RL497_1474 [Pseudomonadota bacterium]|jgi:hypothetical protein
MIKIILFVCFTVGAIGVNAESIAYQKIPNCPSAEKNIENIYANKDLSVSVCYHSGEWDVFAVSSDSHSWLDFKRGNDFYSTEQAVVYEFPNVQFPNLADGKMELHTKNNTLIGVIFRIVQGDSKTSSELYVVKLDATGAYFCGREKANDKARLRLSNISACKPLPLKELVLKSLPAHERKRN